MTSSRGRRSRIALLLLSSLAGCVGPPVALRSGLLTDLSLYEAQDGRSSGATVRWGGTIAALQSHPGETCLEIVGRPLDRVARPVLSDESSGRFLACRTGYLEPEVYTRGREVTVVGRVGELVEGKVGEYAFRMPRVMVDRLYLWPPREVVPPVYVVPSVHFGYWDPYLWGPYRDPWGYRPRRYRPWWW